MSIIMYRGRAMLGNLVETLFSGHVSQKWGQAIKQFSLRFLTSLFSNDYAVVFSAMVCLGLEIKLQHTTKFVIVFFHR